LFPFGFLVRRLTLASAVVGAAALLGWTACSKSELPTVAGSMSKIEDQKPAPDFSLKDADGKVVHLSDYHGKVVLLDFWATWCGPCKIEIPWFEEFERKYKDRGLAVVGVAEDDEGWPVVMPFLKDHSVNYRVIRDDDGKTADRFSVEAFPTTLLIDRNGQITATHVGLTSRKEFEDAIEQLLQVPARSRLDSHSNAILGGPASGADGAQANGL
jgi:peroxiredoxin